MFWNELFVQIPLGISEFYLAVGRDRFVDMVHIVIYRLVAGLGPVEDVDFTLQLLGLVFADQLFAISYQLTGLFGLDDLGRLDSVRQQLDLRQFKIPGADVIARPVTASHTHDVESVFGQCPDIAVNAFALAFHAIRPQS